MASLSSLATVGSARVNSSSFFEGSQPLIGRVILINRSTRKSNGSVSKHGGNRHKWTRIPVYNCLATTGLLEEQGKSFSNESDLKENSGNDEVVLKPAPKPVLRVGPKVNSNPKAESSNLMGVRWAPKVDSDKVSLVSKENARSGNVDDKNGNKGAIESLGEILEKAEKLGVENKGALDGNNGTNNVKGVRTTKSDGNLKPKTLKSVWKKGSPTAYVRRTSTTKSMEIKKKEENSTQEKIMKEEEPVQVIAASTKTPLQPTAPLRAPLRPQPPSQVEPKLQAKPAPVSSVATKKQVILKDVGAAPRQPILKDQGAAPKQATDQKSNLNDVNASSKTATADPKVGKVATAPPKMGKGGAPLKTKDDWRKKSNTTEGLKRRVVSRKAVVPDDEAKELNVPIAGTSIARKGRKFSKASRKAARAEAARAAAPVRVEILEVGKEGMPVPELAHNLAVNEAEVVKTLFMKGIAISVTQTLDEDTVKLVCKEYNVEVIEAESVRVEDMAKKKEIFDEEDLERLEARPPILTIMGHVDHGKTTLMDYIRKTKVAASEAGGITQGIGAYTVLVPVDDDLKPCVFLDTPGHEAFSAMRARGARVTDIAIIVVAADDGVRPQTNEAIAHAKAANVPIVIAINKIDKEGASPERVMQELSSLGLMPEEWGGDAPMVQVSALSGQNVNELLETVMLVAELQELKANPNRNAKGTIIEARLHKSRGPLATFLVHNGTLRKGDVVVCGEAFGKVRALLDHTGSRVDEAGPSMAVQVIGLNNVPVAGDEFEVVDSLDVARERAEDCALKIRDARISAQAGEGKVTLSSLASSVAEGKETGIERHQLNIVLKVDVQGSVEAIREALQVLPQDSVNLRFLMQATGDISASDVDLAVASEAIVVGFNVRVPTAVQAHAENRNVEIRLYRVIYELVDDMRKAMEGLLDPTEEEVPIGAAEVRAVFSSGSGRVAGCMVTEGKVVKGCGIRVVHNGKAVHKGTLDSLRRVKEAVREVSAGLECGIGLRNFDDWDVGDTIEAFNSVAKQRTLEEASVTMAAAVAASGFQQ
eukprot:Gb_26690 [translate_table: standard]